MSSTPVPFPTPPASARLFILGVGGSTIAAVGAAQAASTVPLDVILLAVCLAVCAFGSFYEVQAPGGHWLQPHLLAFVFAALLLPPAAGAAVAVAVFLPGGLKRREDAFRLGFNIAGLALAGTAASVLAGALSASGEGTGDVIGLFAGTLALIVINHALLGVVSSLARGERAARAALAGARLAESFGISLAIDLALALTGASLAALWISYPEALPLAAGPVGLACAALWLPMLRHASRTDPKTGLFNFTHVRHLMSVAVERAQHAGGTGSVLMVDLDHLRAVNNRHGHLAGDTLIAAVAVIIRECTEGRGSAGRFGGEEFCAVLPDCDAVGAREIAEAIRSQVADHRAEGSPPGTVSIGVASFPAHGDDVDAVLHAADMALYDAKLSGRNRVHVAPPRDASTFALPKLAPPPDAPVRVAPAASAAAGTHQSWIPPLVAMLLISTTVFALTCDSKPIFDHPLLFAGLLAATLALDAVRIDVFERLQTSPAAFAVIVLAALFGPLGPIAGEALIAITRIWRKVPLIGLSFDLGALSLSGVAAATAYTAARGLGVDPVTSGLLAGTAYYVVNGVFITTIVFLSKGTSPLTNFREQIAWLYPHYAVFGALAGLFAIAWHSSGYAVFAFFGLPTLLLWIGEQQYVERSRESVEDLRASHADLERANAELHRLLSDNQALLSRLQSAYLSTITSLARTIEAKDPYTGGHTDRVARVTATLAAEMGFSAEELQAVEVGAAIHDIGKIGVPDATLLKPGPLSTDERRVMEQHPEISSYIVAELDVPAIVKQMVRSHHERYDGSGYPDRLSGEEIPLAARILSVADSLDAMTTDRPYRKALSMVEALHQIDSHVDTQFCPTVVAALHRCLQADPGSLAMPARVEAVA